MAARAKASAAVEADAVSPSAATLLRDAERAAERRAGIVRMLIGVVLILVVEAAARGIPADETTLLRQIAAARVTLGCIFLVGLAGWALARQAIGTRVLPFVTASADAVLILGNLAYNHFASGVAGNFFAAFPVAWVIPIALMASAVHYRPLLQAYVAFLYVAGVTAIVLLAGSIPIEERDEALADLVLEFGMPPNGVRIAMIAAAALILVLVARQGRLLLERAVAETTQRLNLVRFLPRELTGTISRGEIGALMSGRRIHAAILFVDIRDSTRLAENLDPARLAVFISSFRRRVMRAATAHGGVVDKFVGDGALIVFGVPETSGDEAARALACARTLLDLIGRWNAKRGFDPALRVGIGVHWGEVFCGVVGAQERLEFTVLGDSVNVASRLEQLTKSHGVPLLASDAILAAAGETRGWREVTHERLRGRDAPLAILAPVDQTGGSPASRLAS